MRCTSTRLCLLGSRTAIILHSTYRETGTPVEEDKSEGPRMVIPFLGIVLDSRGNVALLPLRQTAKHIAATVSNVKERKARKKQELQLLIGSHACKVGALD